MGARVSVLQGPQKVSHIAQLETTTKWAEAKGYEIVGAFEDLGVSASVRPDNRPDLGLWLTEEGADKWDAIVWSKMDRAFRSIRHCVDFAQWAEDRGKVVVFAEDGLTLDYRPGVPKGVDSMMAEMFVFLGSFFAQLELDRFKTRAQDGHRVLRTTTRWASGVPPLGFKVVDHPDGKGRGLATDAESKELLYSMATRLLDGWSFIRIAAWLNDNGVPTNMEKARMAKGKDRYDRPWSVGTVIDALTSPKTQGIKMHKRKTVLDPAGEEIRLGPPTFDTATWNQIQEAAALRQLNRRTPSETSNPMLGVGECGKCGAGLAQQVSRNTKKDGTKNVHRYYRCSRTPLNCNGVFILAETGDDLLAQSFLEAWGAERVTRRVFVPGEDHSDELEQVNRTIERLRRESDSGLIVSADDERVYIERLTALIQRRTALESVPRRESGWVTEELDTTYAESWLTEDHRGLLVGAGIKFVLNRGKPIDFHLYVPQQGGK